MKRKTFNTILIVLFAIASVGIIQGETDRIVGFCMGFNFMISTYFGYETVFKKDI